MEPLIILPFLMEPHTMLLILVLQPMECSNTLELTSPSL